MCTVSGLRTLNTVLGLATVPVLAALLQTIRRQPTLDARTWAEAAVISLFPMHYFYHFFAYTDVASTLLVLLGLLLVYRGHALAAAGVLAASLAFRQTNVVWLALAAATHVLRHAPFTSGLALATASGLGTYRRPSHRPRSARLVLAISSPLPANVGGCVLAGPVGGRFPLAQR